MAFRNEAAIGAFLILGGTGVLACAAQAAEVRHRHLRGGASGVLTVTNEGIRFDEAGKHRDHSRRWTFAEIQQLTLADGTLRILTYEDEAVKFGRDRRFVFDQLPEGLAAELYPLLSRRLDQRFVAALAGDAERLSWTIAAKLLRGARGSQGEIAVSAGCIVYRTVSPEESRTWRIGDIDAVSSSGPFDLTITTFEDAGRDFHFQLKRALEDREYESLWRAVNRSKGLEILSHE